MTNSMRADLLVGCGAVIAPLFYLVVIGQMMFRQGFDLTKHPLSLLALGDHGWIQTLNFLLCGALAIACAVGLLQRIGGTSGGLAGPVLIGLFGVGFIIAGLFPADPLPGFPPGAVDRIATETSAHAKGHGLGFMVAFGALTIACLVFARRFAIGGDATMVAVSGLTALGIVSLIATGMAVQRQAGICFFLVGVVAFGWLSAVRQDRQPTDGTRNRRGGEALAGAPPAPRRRRSAARPTGTRPSASPDPHLIRAR